MRLLAFTLSVILGLSGCSSGPTTLPLTTAGFVTERPAAGTRAMFRELWLGEHRIGYNDGAEEAVREYMAGWLRRVGVVLVVPATSRYQLLEEQRFRLRQDEDVQIGKLGGAALIIEVRVLLRMMEDPAVRVQATSVETGTIVWAGSATMPRCGPREVLFSGTSVPGWMLERLADFALATAFGLTTPGVTLITVDRRCAS